MRRLGIVEFLTLDGVMQSFGGPDEDREGGFEHGGWGAPYATEEIGQRAGQGIGATTAYLFGRKTYEHMAAHWPNEPDENPCRSRTTPGDRPATSHEPTAATSTTGHGHTQGSSGP